MVLPRHVGKVAYKSISVLQGVSSWCAAIALPLSKASFPKDAKGAVSWLAASAGWLQHDGLWLPLSAAIVAALATWLKSYVSPPSIWETIGFVLSEVKKETFNQTRGAPRYHRVTVFKHKRWRFSLVHAWWSGWLVPIERSPDEIPRTIFWAPLANKDNAEGVAGRAWADEETVSKSNLPNLRDNPTEEDFKTYAEETWVSLSWVKKRRPQSRSVTAIPLEVNGKLWGVLVFDSRDPAPISNKSRNLPPMVLKVLQKMLDGR